MKAKPINLKHSDVMIPFRKGGRGSGRDEEPDFGGFCLLLNGAIYIVILKYGDK